MTASGTVANVKVEKYIEPLDRVRIKSPSRGPRPNSRVQTVYPLLDT